MQVRFVFPAPFSTVETSQTVQKRQIQKIYVKIILKPGFVKLSILNI